jgi:hypothetical protein
VNSNGLLDAGPQARPFFCSMPPQRASGSRACENDLSGTWEGDQTSGNDGNGASGGTFEPFIYKNDHFAKTGSGQIQGKLKKDAVFSQVRLGRAGS